MTSSADGMQMFPVKKKICNFVSSSAHSVAHTRCYFEGYTDSATVTSGAYCDGPPHSLSALIAWSTFSVL